MIPNNYHVSKDGVVINTTTGITLTQYEDRDGYLRTNIQMSKNKRRVFLTHRLVLLTYQPIDNMEKFQVNHKDGNRKNNDLENLEWCSCVENIHDRIKRGCHNRKLTEEDAVTIRDLYKTSKTSLRKLGLLFNTDHKVIWKIVNNKTYVVF